ncbi:MAG: hypothetical protein A4S17_08455 [Proteobacteria bacterium HN_bin10]|nr:MAG: hypothetical protein A4S17_08455 [Proteobacteria bacterium HN_bin10]
MGRVVSALLITGLSAATTLVVAPFVVVPWEVIFLISMFTWPPILLTAIAIRAAYAPKDQSREHHG